MTVYKLEFHCSGLANQADIATLQAALGGSPGVNDFSADVHTGRVIVITSNQDGGTDVIRTLVDAGYPPEGDPVVTLFDRDHLAPPQDQKY